VVDSDKLTVSYRDLAGLVRDLRGVGATDLSPDRRRTLTGRGRWAAWLERFNQQRRADGSWSVTLEVICGHAWASPPGAGRATTPGEFAVPLQALRRRP
jgi:malonyl-CoA O-methyltransferase